MALLHTETLTSSTSCTPRRTRLVSWAPLIQATFAILLFGSADLSVASAQSLRIDVTDSPVNIADVAPAVRRHLSDLTWEPTTFQVRGQASHDSDHDAVLRFPSPRVTGDARADEVVMLWFAARDADGAVIEAPAIMILHTVESTYRFSRGLAAQFAARGCHAFVLLMPGYTDPPGQHVGEAPVVTAFRFSSEAVSNGRRGLDVIRALPHVETQAVGLIGISLGGYAAVSVAALDPSLAAVTIVAAGADLQSLLTEGEAEVEQVRRALAAAGVTVEEAAAWSASIEPMAVAHLLDPQRTQLVFGFADRAVPLEKARMLMEAIGIPFRRVTWVAGNHVDTVLRYLLDDESDAMVTRLRNTASNTASRRSSAPSSRPPARSNADSP